MQIEDADTRAISELGGTGEDGEERKQAENAKRKGKGNHIGKRNKGRAPGTSVVAREISKEKKQNKPSRGSKPLKERIKVISVEITNGTRFTGACTSPKTKGPTAEKFIRDTIKRNGLKKIIVGDLNERSRSGRKGAERPRCSSGKD